MLWRRTEHWRRGARRDTTTAAAGPATGGPDVDDTTDSAPQTAEVPGGGQGEDGECAEVSNRHNERQTVLARDLMAAAEAAPGPASPAQIEEIAAAAEAEQGRKGRGPDEPPPEPARSDSRGPCQTDEAPWACEEPPGEEPEALATTTPAPPATTVEPPVQNFDDEPSEVAEDQTPGPRHDGPVTLGAAVPLRSLTEYVCLRGRLVLGWLRRMRRRQRTRLSVPPHGDAQRLRSRSPQAARRDPRPAGRRPAGRRSHRPAVRRTPGRGRRPQGRQARRHLMGGRPSPEPRQEFQGRWGTTRFRASGVQRISNRWPEPRWSPSIW